MMIGGLTLDATIEDLLNFIQQSRGFDFRGYKRTSLRRRIAIRMDAVGADSFAAYQARLEADPGEYDALLDTVLINVTSFFRDPDAWASLRTDVLPDMLRGTGSSGPIRIWSVGCATGQEPYSIAMELADLMPTHEFLDRVKIYATDLDEEALRVARLATYTPGEVEGVPAERLETYFERTAHHYVFNRDLRRCVIFGRHNVVRDAPISRIDLLICRNLLIYLEAETQDLVLPRLYYSLVPDGYLFLGKAETQMARSQLFKPVDSRHRIFQKASRDWRRTAGGGLAAARSFPPLDGAASGALLFEQALNEVGAAVLVINDAGCVALANLAARRLLGVAEPDIGRPFQDLSISYRPLELRGPIEQVMLDHQPVRLEHQEFAVSPLEMLRLTVEIRLLSRPDGLPYAVMLTFTDTTRLFNMQRELDAAQENLEQSIEELQSANEELETTNEGLQSTNEELETTNEELQSTNEELETIAEESRSTAEEMEAANEELRIRTGQALHSAMHLRAILRSLNVGIIVLDRMQIIESWNRWNENTWGLRAEEAVGRPFASLDIGFPVQSQVGNLQRVRNGEQVAEQLVEGVDRRGRNILCRIRLVPLLDDNASPVGGVMVMEDVTAERRRDDYERHLGRVLGQALNEIYFLDPETLRFTIANRGAELKLGCHRDQLTQVSLADLLPAGGVEDLKLRLEPLFGGEQSEIVIETTITSLDGRSYPAQICFQYFADEDPPILLALVHDTTARVRLSAD